MKILSKFLSSRSEMKEIYKSRLIEVDDDTRVQLQSLLLEMYKDVYALCRKYGITPFIGGGCALGAVRHNGFIPWDDDLDFCMFRNEYRRFLSLFEKELSDKYVINAPNYSKKPKARFAKIMRKGTICREVGDRSPDSECGVFIDLFIIDNIPDNIIYRCIKGIICNAMEFVSGQVYFSSDKSISVKDLDTVNKIKWFIGFVFSFLYPHEWFNLIDKTAQHKNDKSKNVAVVTGRKHYFGEILKREDVLPARYIRFCDIEIPVFNNFEKYLEVLYGEDYMQLPPESKRERHFVKKLEF